MAPRTRFFEDLNKGTEPKTMVEIEFNKLPHNFQAVVDAWDISGHPIGFILVALPGNKSVSWAYTGTYRYIVTISEVNFVLSGHVHYYTNTDGSLKNAAPGKYWIRGIAHYDAITPTDIVVKFGAPDLLEKNGGFSY